MPAITCRCLGQTLWQSLLCIVKVIAFYVYGTFLLVVTFAVLVILGGPVLVGEGLVFAGDEQRLKQEYLDRGVEMQGEVARHWSVMETTSSESEQSIEKAIVCYTSDGDRYQMTLVPLDARVRLTMVQNTVPILLLPDHPTSGVPRALVDVNRTFGSTWCGRFLTICVGCTVAGCVATGVALSVIEDNPNPPSPLLVVSLSVGCFVVVTAVVIFVMRPIRRNGLLRFGQKMEDPTVLDMNHAHLPNPLISMDQWIRKRCRSCCSRCLHRDSS